MQPDFNSRPSARGDLTFVEASAQNKKFQFTPLREGRHPRAPRVLLPHHFNSRPSARGDNSSDEMIGDKSISIHAPPRGATCVRVWLEKCSSISIHAPPRGATFRLQRDYHGALISIHAPPRGATWIGLISPLRNLFQFTPLREGRQNRKGQCAGIPNFNSRPSARGDENRKGQCAGIPNFNSRPSARGDLRYCRA